MKMKINPTFFTISKGWIKNGLRDLKESESKGTNQKPKSFVSMEKIRVTSLI